MLFLIINIEQESWAKQKNNNKLFENLLSQIALENIVALEQLYLASKAAVYGFALSIVKNPETAEDIMQETYIKIYKAAGQYTPQGKPMAWILTIVKNLAFEKLRERKRLVENNNNQWIVPVENDFSQSYIDHIVLQNAIKVLTEEEWQIVSLHSLSGLKHREIATLLEMPLSTVLSKYHRALVKLKKTMKEENV